MKALEVVFCLFREKSLSFCGLSCNLWWFIYLVCLL